MAVNKTEYKDIVKQIKLRQFPPIYVLMGEEPYFIDKLTGLLEESVLTEDEKFMNFSLFYGKDCRVGEVINEARQYPTMSQMRLVMIKETQTLDKKGELDLLEHYIAKPMPSTVLVIAYKYGTIDGRKKWISAAAKTGVVFNSEKLRDYQLPSFIENLAKTSRTTIEPEAVNLLAEYVGADLSLLETTLEKLRLQLGEGKRITADAVANSVGISKDYTPFELLDSLINRNAEKCYRVAAHTTSAIQQTIAVLFNYFSNLMIYHYLADKSNAVTEMKIRPYFLKDYEKGARNYTKMQAFRAVGYLREYDRKSKGSGNFSADSGQLMDELIFKILH